MLLSSMPPRFPIPFANAAGPAFIRPIPTESQIGIQDGAASLTDGFPPDCFTPIVAGGVPPFGQDANGILNRITAWLRWVQAGGIATYDFAFATAIGGYPLYSVLTTNAWSSGTRWMTTVDGNTDDPDFGGLNWVQDPSQVPIGTPMPFVAVTLPFGYAPANGGTIGNSASNASVLADTRQAFLLYKQIWLNYPNSQCPVFNSSGVPVGRGANPIGDFNADNQIQVPDLRGRGITGADFGGTARLNGVPIISGASTVAGSILGENLHQLLAAELAAHAHANSLTDPGHGHGLTDPGHSHPNSLTDPGHSHPNSLTDPGHSHANSLTDPGHFHRLVAFDNSLNGGNLNPVNYPRLNVGSDNTVVTDTRSTGISINNATNGTGVTINNAGSGTGLTINNAGAATGVSVNNNGTNVSINNASSGGNGSHNNVAEAMGVTWGLKT